MRKKGRVGGGGGEVWWRGACDKLCKCETTESRCDNRVNRTLYGRVIDGTLIVLLIVCFRATNRRAKILRRYHWNYYFLYNLLVVFLFITKQKCVDYIFNSNEFAIGIIRSRVFVSDCIGRKKLFYKYIQRDDICFWELFIYFFFSIMDACYVESERESRRSEKSTCEKCIGRKFYVKSVFKFF